MAHFNPVAIIAQIRVKYKHYFAMETLMTPLQERIAKLELKLQQEKAKQAQIEAKQRAMAKKKNHADDTRRKILIGAIVLNKVTNGDWPESKFIKMVNVHLTRDDDRALFGLAPLPKDQTTDTGKSDESTD